MDTQYLTRARIQEIEREMSRIRLAAAAEAKPQRRAADEPSPQTVTGMPLRLLRALRSAA